MSTSEVIYPFVQIRNLELNVAAPLDQEGNPISEVAMPEPDEYGIKEMDVAEAHDWTQLEFAVSFSVPPGSLLEVLPKVDSTKKETVALISMVCSSAKFRQGWRLELTGDGTWSGNLTVARQDIRGSLLLTPELVRSVDATKIKPDQAAFAGAVLGTGPGVRVTVDRFARAYKGPLTYKWEEFSKSTNTWVAERPDDVYFADLRDVPRLHLNLRWKSLQPILTNTAIAGYPAALKNAYAAALGQSVWAQMLAVSVSSIQHDEESDSYAPGDGWQGQILKRVVEDLYPDSASGDAYHDLFVAMRNPEEAATIISKLGSLAHDMSDAGVLLDRAARLAATGGSRSEANDA